jgi:uncharacterized repeat protein (TIGR03803 family)
MKNTMQNWNRISTMRPRAALALTALLVLAFITAGSAQAQTYTVLASFNGTNGSYSLAPLVQATNGKLYGTTDQVQDSSGLGGTVFEITTSGTLTSLYAFCQPAPPCSDGYGPVAGLVQATDGDLYGTTEYGGSGGGNPFGTVFKITPSGTLTTLDSFPVDDGDAPEPTAGLVQAANGDLYGATTGGGVNGAGTLFSVTQGGLLNTIYNFCSNPNLGVCTPGSLTSYDGYDPLAGLTQATNGDLYGTTLAGGINSGGTIFKTTTSGALTVLYRFCSQINGSGDCTDGANPYSVLVQGTNGNFYGTTAEGGTGAFCPVIYGCGTIFEITAGGTLTTLYSFCSQSGCADGYTGGNLETPQAALIQGSDGNLYGTTPYGGTGAACPVDYGCGSIFEFNLTTDTLTTLYNFCSQDDCTDGGEPAAGLMQDTNGTFYGTTSIGNGEVIGTVYSLSTGLGPFVKTQPASGKVGTAVRILGTDLTGATSVTFNGTAAAFTVVSSSEIRTSVPTGATAGYVAVTTPTGTLTTNVPFLLSTALITTTATLTSSPNPSTFGEPVTFTAVVGSNAGAPPNGETVSFQKGTTVLGTGTLSGGAASFTTSTLPVGTTAVKAVYGGDAYFKKSTSNVVRQVVGN